MILLQLKKRKEKKKHTRGAEALQTLYFNCEHFGLPILKKYNFVEYLNHWRWTCYVFLPNGKDSYIAQIRFYKNLNQLEISKDYGLQQIHIQFALKLNSLIENKLITLYKNNIIILDNARNKRKYIRAVA